MSLKYQCLCTWFVIIHASISKITSHNKYPNIQIHLRNNQNIEVDESTANETPPPTTNDSEMEGLMTSTLNSMTDTLSNEYQHSHRDSGSVLRSIGIVFEQAIYRIIPQGNLSQNDETETQHESVIGANAAIDIGDTEQTVGDHSHINSNKQDLDMIRG